MKDEFDWFMFKADLCIAEPELDEKTGEFTPGLLQTKVLTQELLTALDTEGGYFALRVDATTEELWLRVSPTNAKDESPDEDVVFINLGRRNAERLRDALDAALKMRDPRASKF